MVGSPRENAKVLVKRLMQRSGVEVKRGAQFPAVVSLASSLGVSTLLDVGANEGQFARLFRAARFEGDIYSYEPMSRESGIAAGHARGDARWTVINSALGASNGQLEINVSRNSYSSSLLPISRRHVDAAPASAVDHVETVEVRTLEEELRRLRVDPTLSMLKIDTQGYERAVLEGAGGAAHQFALLQLELSMVALYEGAPEFDDFYPWLRDHGWRLWSLDPGFTGPDGEMLQCDGVFVRSASPRRGTR